MKTKIEIISLNVKGLGCNIKRRKLFTWLKKQQIPIALLQETHSTEESEKQWLAEWGGKAIFSHGASNARGAAILFNPTLQNVEIQETKVSEQGRFVILDLKIHEMSFTLANVYAPNNDDPQYFNSIFGIIENMPNDNRIIGGDFNLVLDIQKDKQGGRMKTHKNAQEVILNWMEDADMVDIWRRQHINARQYTYHTTHPYDIWCRLDFYLVSFGLIQSIHKSSITHGYLSDHSSVRIILVTSMDPRGPGFWKLNTSVLEDAEYVAKIKEAIQNTVKDNVNADPLLLWDTIKLQCRGNSIEYCSRKKKEKRNKIKEMEKQIWELQNKIEENSTPELEAELEQIKSMLDEEVEKIAKGNILRCQAKWCEEGERSSSYFLNLEKRNYNNKTITKLKKANGQICEEKEKIQELQMEYYSKLYTSNNVGEALANDQIFFNLEIPKLSPEQVVECEGPLTEAELYSALKTTKKNKAPGSDGFPCEFYSKFWGDIKEYLLAAANHSFLSGELSITQKQGVITLLPKKDRDPLLLKNWRPLSLLNQDYKLIAKTLAIRMKKHLEHIIHPDQTGFINNRYIGQNIVRILDLMEFTEQEKIPAVIMSIDYEKAFDCVEWKYIDKVLEHFAFGPDFRRWVKILYTDIESCVINNGWITRFFKLTRGVRQGCPMSPYLFVLGAELLSIAIRHNQLIRGVNVANVTHKIIQYADDTALSLLGEKETLCETFKLLNKFSELSGLRINIDKTKILRIGALKHSDEVLSPEYNVVWTSESLNMLGVIICNDRTKLCEANYGPKLTKIENTIRAWRQRNLTIYGRLALIKSLLFSQIVYLMSVLPAPSDDYINRIERILFQFLWNSKTERISRQTLLRPYNEGGLKMPHLRSFNSATKLAWLKRLIQVKNTQNWTSCFLKKLPIQDDILWTCNLEKGDAKYLVRNTSRFWYEVVVAWCDYNYKSELTYVDIKRQVIWFNSFIRIDGKPIYYKNCYEAGMTYIEDLVKEDGLLLTYEEIEEKFNELRIDRLTYYGIISAIPRRWKEILRNDRNVNTNGGMVNTVEKILAMQKVCQKSYESFVRNYLKEWNSSAKSKWENELGVRYEKEDYCNLFSNICTYTTSTKLRTFQFLMLHRAIVTNVDLYKWKVKNCNVCNFCKQEPETIFHLIWQCVKIANLWEELFIWLRTQTQTNIRFTPQEILLGTGKPELIFYDKIFLVVKQFIYACRCLETQPSLQGIVRRIKHQQDIEKQASIIYNKIHVWESTWQPLL